MTVRGSPKRKPGSRLRPRWDGEQNDAPSTPGIGTSLGTRPSRSALRAGKDSVPMVAAGRSRVADTSPGRWGRQCFEGVRKAVEGHRWDGS